MQGSIAFLVRVQCRRKESSRSLSHLLMSFLSNTALTIVAVVLTQMYLNAIQLVVIYLTVSL